MNRNLIFIFISFFVIISACYAPKQNDNSSRSTPSAESVSSQNILNFIEAIEKNKNELHSLMIMRHGKIIAEGWWNPYQPDLKHTVYSTSKSFTSTAIGFAVSEKRLSLNDKVISFFLKDVPDVISPNLSALTVKDLITMSAGQEPDPTFDIVTRDSNWVKSFLATPIKNKPGTKFLYNTLATYMLSAIVQKVTGEKVIDYLKPRLFEPLKIESMDWEVDPQGRNTGGWGLRLKTEDMAKFGQFYLQKGKWNNMQLLPAEWIEDATSFKIDQAPGLPQSTKDSSDWMQGYCYQFWRCRNNGYRADGAFGQYIIVLPDKDAVIVITSETPDMQDVLNLVWEYLLPAFENENSNLNKEIDEKLGDKLVTLALPLFPASKPSKITNTIQNKTYAIARNQFNIDSLKFFFNQTECTLNINAGPEEYKLAFGSGKWIPGETKKAGPSLLSMAKEANSGLPPFKIAGNYQWKNDSILELKLRYIESPHSELMVCTFNKDNISIDVSRSFDFGSQKTKLQGILKK